MISYNIIVVVCTYKQFFLIKCVCPVPTTHIKMFFKIINNSMFYYNHKKYLACIIIYQIKMKMKY